MEDTKSKYCRNRIINSFSRNRRFDINYCKVRGLKTGSTVLIATDSLTGKTVATHITVSEGFTNPKIAIGEVM